MFERYTEGARRVVFFGRYEASQFASGYIETEHLLLGLLREDTIFKEILAPDAPESIRQQVAEGYPGDNPALATSVDLPLSMDSKKALQFAANESERMGQRVIHCGHIVLGLLCVESCRAAVILRQRGITLESYRKLSSRYPRQAGHAPAQVASEPQRAGARRSSAEVQVSAESLAPTVLKLSALIDRCSGIFDSWGDVEAAQHLKRQPWSRKEALGHLVDWGATYQRWIARALTEPNMTARFYPQQEWVGAQHYAEFPWQEMVDLWVCQNRLLVHVLSHLPESKLETKCKVGLDEPVALRALIVRYVDHCEDEMAQILTLG